MTTYLRLLGGIGLLHVTGWSLFLLALVNSDSGTGKALTVGAGLTAYLLGVRHAFDADHIAAIDNTTRHLRRQGQSPVSVGFWFSLGHSTIVLLGCIALAIGWKALAAQIGGESEGAILTFTGIWGPTVSGLFLIAIGVLNALILRDLLAARREGEEAAEEALARRGLMNRVFGRRAAMIRRPRHMYAVGFLFGLGFDTATSVGLLLLAAGVGAATLPWYAFIALPLIFAAGMTLFDTADGAAMNYAYGWADRSYERRIGYNIVVTSVSVAVAFLIGVVNLSGVAAEHGWSLLSPVAGLNLDLLGFALVAFFMVAWAAAVTLRRRPMLPAT